MPVICITWYGNENLTFCSVGSGITGVIIPGSFSPSGGLGMTDPSRIIQNGKHG